MLIICIFNVAHFLLLLYVYEYIYIYIRLENNIHTLAILFGI